MALVKFMQTKLFLGMEDMECSERRVPRWYVSGPMAVFGNDQEYLTKLFTGVAHSLRLHGIDPTTPLEDGLSWDAGYAEHLTADLLNLSKCDGLYLLPGWEHSKGCAVELHWAVIFGIPIYYNMASCPLCRFSAERSRQLLFDGGTPFNEINWEYGEF